MCFQRRGHHFVDLLLRNNRRGDRVAERIRSHSVYRTWSPVRFSVAGDFVRWSHPNSPTGFVYERHLNRNESNSKIGSLGVIRCLAEGIAISHSGTWQKPPIKRCPSKNNSPSNRNCRASSLSFPIINNNNNDNFEIKDVVRH